MTEANNQTPQKNADPLIGQTLMGCYQILDILGMGGMAVVYKAKQLHTDRMVAIKTLKAKDETVMRRFFREMQTLSKLKHQNIIEAIDCIETPDGQTFFAMEFVDGISLQEMVRSLGRVQKEDDIAAILLQICEALEHAHKQGIIHRDLKPGNIMLVETDGTIQVKVLDFGIAKIQDDLQKLTTQGEALGSPLYMSPEQCMGLDLTPASDVYSLAVVAYELITGKPPYQFPTVYKIMEAHCTPGIRPEPISTHRPDIKGANQLDQIMQRALETELPKRFDNIGDFKKSIAFWSQSCRLGQEGRALPADLGTAQTPKKTKAETPGSIRDLQAIREKSLQSSTAIMRADRREVPPSEKQKSLPIVKLAAWGVAFCLLALAATALILFPETVRDTWISASQNVSNLLTPKTPTRPVTKEASENNRTANTDSQEPAAASKDAPDALVKTTTPAVRREESVYQPTEVRQLGNKQNAEDAKNVQFVVPADSQLPDHSQQGVRRLQ